MADCTALRPDLLDYHDGEASPRVLERIEAHLHTCQDCRDFLSRAAWEVGLFLLNQPASASRSVASGPSAGFEARVMDAVRATPRTAAPAAPASPAAPPLRLVPPAPRVLAPRVLAPRVLAWRTWAAAAALLATAAAAAFLVLNGEPNPVPSQQHPNPEGRGVVAIRDGGALRWNDRAAFDRGLAESAWIAKGDAVPTLPGEYLHSPAPSSVRVQLPGGGQLDAGPLSSLALSPEFDTDRGVALLEGALTATAANAPGAPGSPPPSLNLDAPGVHVESTGAVEMSVQVEGGARAAAKWFEARADAIARGAAPPAPPASKVLVFAREGSLVATAAGPVRNSLERHNLGKGQALVLIGPRVYLQMGVDDDAPPEVASVLGGMPIPPDSRFFASTAPQSGSDLMPSGGGNTLMAAGPVRNSLERTLGNPASDPEVRADALMLYESFGGVEAVDAAVKAVDDPAIQVRCAAVRILALNCDADRPKALAALRRLAVDVDPTTAVFAIRALQALDDRGSIPVLRTLVVDDDAPPDEVQVAAFGVLVGYGDTTRVTEAAAHLDRLNPASVLGLALQRDVTSAFLLLPPERTSQFLRDPRPGVAAAALFASKDVTAARAALSSPTPAVVLAGVNVLLRMVRDPAFGDFRPIVESSPTLRNGFIIQLHRWSIGANFHAFPDWILSAAESMLMDPLSSPEECVASCTILGSHAPEGLFERLMSSGTGAQRLAIVSLKTLDPRIAVQALRSTDALVASGAIRLLADLRGLPESTLPTTTLLDALAQFKPYNSEDARLAAMALASVARDRKSEEAVQALLGFARSGDPLLRRAAPFGLGPISDRPEASALLEVLLADKDSATAEAAVDQAVLSSRRSRWSGRPLTDLFPSTAPSPVVRVQLAQIARKAGIVGADDVIARELEVATPSQRAAMLKRALDYGFPLGLPVPTLSKDPVPLVRLLYLMASTDTVRADAARLLADDPMFWVQALSMAILAQNEDAAALEGLRALVRAQSGLTTKHDPFLAGLNPDSKTLSTDVIKVSRMAVNVSSTVNRESDSTSATSRELFAKRGFCRWHSKVLLTGGTPSERISSARSLGDCDLPLSLDCLFRAATEDMNFDPSVVAEARLAIETLLGFSPPPDIRDWVKVHRRGFVGYTEIRALSGH